MWPRREDGKPEVTWCLFSLRDLWLLCHEHQRRQHSGVHTQDRHGPQQSLKNLPSSAYVCDQGSGPCECVALPTVAGVVSGHGVWSRLGLGVCSFFGGPDGTIGHSLCLRQGTSTEALGTPFPDPRQRAVCEGTGDVMEIRKLRW